MKRAGFTMIELIFVIVILGILSAVAVPKMMGVSDKAKAGVCGSYYSSLNGTVSPSLWTQMSIDNEDVTTVYTETNIGKQIAWPKDYCYTDSSDNSKDKLNIVEIATDDNKSFIVEIGKTKYDVNGTKATSSNPASWTWTKHKE